MSQQHVAEDAAHPIVMNAIVDVVADQQSVLANEASREVVWDAYRATTTDTDRRDVEAAVAAIKTHGDDVDVSGDQGDVLVTVTDAVLDELAAQDVRATVEHVAPVSLPARDAYLSSFTATRDPAAVAGLSLPETVGDAVESGCRAVADGAFDRATSYFERAVDASAGVDGPVATRVLAAWANHRHGDDNRAIDFVEEALHLDTGAWSAKAVGLAAGHRRPEKFRRGKLGARVFLRQSVEVPPEAAVTAAAGVAGDGGVEWIELSGTDECMPIDRLGPETRIRLTLEGPVASFPTMLGYYVALGVVDLEVHEARSVERVLFGGPDAEGVTETVQFHQ